MDDTGEPPGWSRQGRRVPTQSQEDQETIAPPALNFEVKACPPSQVKAYSACGRNPI